MAERAPREAELRAARAGKLAELRAAGWAWPNDFRPTHRAAELHAAHGAAAAEALPAAELAVAGRMMLKRVQGKTSFVQLQDESGRIQLMALREALGDAAYAEFKRWDLGDVVGARGALMRTRTGELTVRVRELRLLAKALRAPPEKFHGLHDVETRYRRRHLDLLANERSRTLFRRRSRLLAELRRQLDERGFLEVETPLLHPVAGGAKARPFETRHEALHRTLYLRVAPELYLKRLVVGGFERVFELNRSFRNEGLSAQHNPEFTMLELYQAHADYRDLMRLLEELLPALARAVLGGTRVCVPAAAEDEEDQEIDLAEPFERLTLREAVQRHFAEKLSNDSESAPRPSVQRWRHFAENPGLDDAAALAAECAELEIDVPGDESAALLQLRLFEHAVESKLLRPTFVTEYPVAASPLARRCDRDPERAERFELFAAGRELANGFSELNDPEDQAERFRRQAELRAGGDPEAMRYDEEYVRALEHGLPPTAGVGVGIDRLAMLLCGERSIREVLLFPQLRAAADEA